MWKVHSYKTIVSDIYIDDILKIVQKRRYTFSNQSSGLTKYWKRPGKCYPVVISTFEGDNDTFLYIIAIYKNESYNI